jgi:DNA polymerase V
VLAFSDVGIPSLPAMPVTPLRSRSNVAGIYSAAKAPSELRLRYFRAPSASAGFPSPAGDYVEEELDLNAYLVRNKTATYFFRIRGDSLCDIGIMDGDIGAVDRSIPAQLGRVVVATVDGEIVCKVFEHVDDRPALVSRNERVKYPVIYLDACQDHTIWGCVTSVSRKF